MTTRPVSTVAGIPPRRAAFQNGHLMFLSASTVVTASGQLKPKPNPDWIASAAPELLSSMSIASSAMLPITTMQSRKLEPSSSHGAGALARQLCCQPVTPLWPQSHE